MLAQTVPPPTGDAWPWVAGIMAMGGAYLLVRFLGDKDVQIRRCLDEVKTLREVASRRADKLEADIDRLRGERRE
jgi:hypothetical protein